uniref:Uncharacterized protein n=1 Tax=Glossina austeni TaxID=7395 RepID=A0A1A9VLH8_GLOAU
MQKSAVLWLLGLFVFHFFLTDPITIHTLTMIVLLIQSVLVQMRMRGCAGKEGLNEFLLRLYAFFRRLTYTEDEPHYGDISQFHEGTRMVAFKNMLIIGTRLYIGLSMAVT